MTPPSDAATYERACRYANNALWTLALQRRRLKSTEPEDADFVFRVWADFEFFIVALTRLRRAAILAGKIPAIKTAITAALADFDTALPMVKNMRDVAEHFDDYALDKGRLASITRQGLEVGVFSDTTFEWLGNELNADVALSASERLFMSMKQCQTLVVGIA